MSTETEVPMLADYFILSLMRLDRDHCQRVEAVRSVTGDDMEIFLFAPNANPTYHCKPTRLRLRSGFVFYVGLLCSPPSYHSCEAV